MRNRLAFLFCTLFFFLLFGCGDSTSTAESASSLPAEAEGRTILTIACTDKMEGIYDAEIDSFNRSQTEYYLQERVYAVPEGADETEYHIDYYQGLLLEDLENGTAPDIISFDGFYINPTNEMFSGYLADLYPYLDSDGELSRASLISSFLSAYETNGKLLGVANELQLRTISAAAWAAGEDGLWTPADVAETARTIGGAERLSYVESDPEGFADKLLESWLYPMYAGGTGDFDPETCRSILETASKVTRENVGVTQKAGESALYLDSIRSYFYPQFFRTAFRDDYVFATDEEGNYLSCWFVLHSLGMNAGSENKDGAWQFLRTFFTADYQEQYSDFPSNREALEKQAQDALAGNATVTLEDGWTVDYTGYIRTDNLDMTFSAATQEDIERINDLIEHTTLVYDTALANEICDDTLPGMQYVAGKLTLDEAMNMITPAVEERVGASSR